MQSRRRDLAVIDGGAHVATGTDRMENAELDRLVKEVSGYLNKARALLAMAHRFEIGRAHV